MKYFEIIKSAPKKFLLKNQNEKTYNYVILLFFYFKIDVIFFIFHQNMIAIRDIIPRNFQIKSTLLKHSYHNFIKNKKKIFASLYFDIRIKIGQNLDMKHKVILYII